MDVAKKSNWDSYVHNIYEDTFCGLINIKLSLYLH